MNTSTRMANPTISSLNAQNFAHLKCSLSTLVCREKTIILGDVTIGSDCVIHPTTVIDAKNGPIILGNNNLIEERANIVNSSQEPMIIGDGNVFEVDSHCCARKVGNNNTFEAKSRVGTNVEVVDNCVIGAGCKLDDPNLDDDTDVSVIPSNTVIAGGDMSRQVLPQLATSSTSSQLDFLRKILPNYQKLWRPLVQPAAPQ